MFSPKGAVVRTMRLTKTDVLPDGTKVKMAIAASGVVVVVRSDSTSRRKFAEFCRFRGLICHPVERAAATDGSFKADKRGRAVETVGASKPAAEYADPSVTAWQVMGDGPALSLLVGMDDVGRVSEPKPFVADWGFALNVRPPRGAQGSGPELTRPSNGKGRLARDRSGEAPDAVYPPATLADVMAHHRDVLRTA